MSYKEKNSTTEGLTVRAVTTKATRSNPMFYATEDQPIHHTKESRSNPMFYESKDQPIHIYQQQEPIYEENGNSYNVDLEAGIVPGADFQSRTRRFLMFLKEINKMIWWYLLKQIYLSIPTLLTVASMLGNPPLICFIAVMMVFSIKITVESVRDAKNRNVYGYASNMNDVLGLALFFFTIFGVIHNYKLKAGMVDNKVWLDSWPLNQQLISFSEKK